MVVEHIFVTTLESPEALSAASAFLQAGGFAAVSESAFRLDGGWTTLEMQRGKKRGRPKSVADCPQQVRLEWDRGRVTVAASITPSLTGGGSFRLTGFGYGYGALGGVGISPTSKRAKPYNELMIAIAQGLDDLLARRVPLDEARRAWIEQEAQIQAAARKARIRSWIMLGIVLLVIFGAIALGVILAVRGK